MTERELLNRVGEIKRHAQDAITHADSIREAVRYGNEPTNIANTLQWVIASFAGGIQNAAGVADRLTNDEGYLDPE